MSNIFTIGNISGISEKSEIVRALLNGDNFYDIISGLTCDIDIKFSSFHISLQNVSLISFSVSLDCAIFDAIVDGIGTLYADDRRVFDLKYNSRESNFLANVPIFGFNNDRECTLEEAEVNNSLIEIVNASRKIFEFSDREKFSINYNHRGNIYLRHMFGFGKN